MSLPGMGWPISALGGAFFFVRTLVFILFLAGGPGAEEKNHDRFQPWVFVENRVNCDKFPQRARLRRRRRLTE
jgi:hypothetical protein